jgi:hypothetical protein
MTDERTGTLIRTRSSGFGVPRHCSYCGRVLRTNRIVCEDHADLPNLDPQFSNPRVVQAPVGVQVFAAGGSQ